MARYPRPREFDPKTPKVARRPFRIAGRQFQPEEPFPWHLMGISTRRVMQMFMAGKVKDAGPQIATAPVTPGPEPVSEPPKPIPAPEADDDLPDNMGELRFIAELEGAPIKRSKAEQKAAILEHRANG